MNRKIYLIIFIAGVAVHLLYLLLLLEKAPIDQLNWSFGDTDSYVQPAKAFIENGTFAYKGVPDYRRTIGYPLFLAGVISISNMVGIDWRLIGFLLQSMLFALVYPAIYFIGCNLFGLKTRSALGCVFFTIVSGAFISYVPVILSDAFFATVFIVGIACGVFVLNRQSVTWSLIYILIITFAANIRPMLALFPFSGVCMHFAHVKHKIPLPNKLTYSLIVVVFIFTLFGTQTPALRNYYHHRVFTPTEIGSINLFDYLAKNVLIHKGDNSRYEKVSDSLDTVQSHDKIEDRISIRKNNAFQVYLDYPFETFFFLGYYMILNSLETHWQNLFYLFKKTWYKNYSDGFVLWAPISFIIAIIFIAIYGVIYFSALLSIFHLKKKPLMAISAFLFFIPYLFCATNYQGARFRLWMEPFVVMAAMLSIQKIFSQLQNWRWSNFNKLSGLNSDLAHIGK